MISGGQQRSIVPRLALIAAAVAAMYAWFRPGAPEELTVGKPTARARPGTAPEDEPAPLYFATVDARIDLEGLLRRFAAANEPSRARIVHFIRHRFDEFERPLIGFVSAQLETPLDLLVPAIGVAGWLMLWQVENDLVSMLDDTPPEVCAAAVRALHRFDYWKPERLDKRLRMQQSVESLEALLECAATVAKPPLSAILPLLAHPVESVRAAAAATFGETPPPDALAELTAFTDRAEGIQRIDAIKLLGRLDSAPARDESLLRALDTEDYVQRLASLKALMQGSTPLRDAGPVWQRIEAPATSVTELVHALAVLEQRDSVDTQRVIAWLPKLHPVARVQAARCLVRAGAAPGVAALIELLQTEEGPGVDDEQKDCAREESRRILTELAGEDLGPGPDDWRPWHRRNAASGPRELRRPPRLAW